MSVITEIVNQDSCFFCFMNYLKLLGPFAFCSFYFNYLLNVFDYSYSNSCEELIFCYSF